MAMRIFSSTMMETTTSYKIKVDLLRASHMVLTIHERQALSFLTSETNQIYAILQDIYSTLRPI